MVEVAERVVNLTQFCLFLMLTQKSFPLLLGPQVPMLRQVLEQATIIIQGPIRPSSVAVVE
jgi:hypothetical protein